MRLSPRLRLLTVVLANVAEAETVAQSRGKAQAGTLRRARRQITARRLVGGESGTVEGSYVEEGVAAAELRRDGRRYRVLADYLACSVCLVVRITMASWPAWPNRSTLRSPMSN
ncbi:hypothetical protein [Streptomyces sp. STR69]|uniref:hypothetical protein n=1 Tax=Streptomyces sp. STR69 TaxID=1796942 RepID=UPI0021C609D8|nr:hypothetical protein [Streptomyces sp. STR69]